jgi:hypothetical protein
MPAPPQPAPPSWKPTKKWLSGLVVGVLTIFANFLASGEFDGTERGQLVLLAIALAGSYFKTNDQVPGGVPRA